MGGAVSMMRHGFSQGFMIPAPTVTEKNLPDQTSKVFIITGANSGVGYEVSRLLYSLHATVYMGCRSESKANEAIAAIQKAHPASHGKLVYLHLDLSDLSTIKSSVNTFLAKESRLDWLNNNAGVMVPPAGSKTAQGHELQIGTNVLGPFLLTKLLTPILQTTASQLPASDRGTVRVSWAGSFGVDFLSPTGGVQFTTSPEGENEPKIIDFNGGGRAYGTSKAANWFLAHEFGRRQPQPKQGVLHNAYNPGNLSSGLQRHAKTQFGTLPNLLLEKLMLYPSVMGAYTEIYAGLSRDLTLEHDQGGYVVPWGRKSVWNRKDVVEALTREGQEEGGRSQVLWDWCERETRAFL